MTNIVIFGAPGSGKGTQSDKLINEFNFLHISTGDVLRDNIRRETPLGKVVKGIIEQGKLVPDETMVKLLASVLDEQKENAANGVIFDGFPRTVAQAEALDQMLAERGTAVHVVIGLEVPEEELVARILRRGQLAGRADDNAETAQKRLDVYHQQTAPLKQYYEDKNLYRAINGLGDIDEIYAAIKAALPIS